MLATTDRDHPDLGSLQSHRQQRSGLMKPRRLVVGGPEQSHARLTTSSSRRCRRPRAFVGPRRPRRRCLRPRLEVWGTDRQPLPEMSRAIPIRTAWDRNRMNEAPRKTAAPDNLRRTWPPPHVRQRCCSSTDASGTRSSASCAWASAERRPPKIQGAGPKGDLSLCRGEGFDPRLGAWPRLFSASLQSL